MIEPLDVVPGFSEAVGVLRQVGGVLLPEGAAQALAVALVLTVTPIVKAEVLADISDDLLAYADLLFSGSRAAGDPHATAAWTLVDLSDALDRSSAMIRKPDAP